MAAIRKSKHMRGNAFSVKVCDAIRHHIGERKALESKRKIAFEDRDAAVEEKQGIEDHDSEEYLHACKMHSDAIAEIESLDASIKWHRNQIDSLVEKADEDQFEFMYDPPAEGPKKKPAQLRLAGENDNKPKDKPKPEAPLAPAIEGVDEHLKASINELDMREDFKGLLLHAGLTTIAHLVDHHDTDVAAGIKLQARLNCDAKTAAAIYAAVKKYRKAHRNAAREVESA